MKFAKRITLTATLGALATGALGSCGPTEPSIVERCKARLPGDLVISEFMNNPAGTDTGSEYIELYNATGAEIDLKGLSLVHAGADGDNEKEYIFNDAKIPAGGYFVAGDARAEPKPTWMNYSYADKLGALRNDSGLLAVRCGTKLIDEVKYTVASGSGHSRELDGSLVPDSAVNDTETNFCDSVTLLSGENFGTPGAANAKCGSSGAKSCNDASTGAPRTPVTPQEGDLVITEFMPDPAIVADTEGEWVEIYAPTRAVDLNGIVVESGSSQSQLGSETCLHIPAGSYAIIARNDDATVNGGLDSVTAKTTVSLPNSGGTLTLRNGNTVIDTVTWTSSSAGASNQLSASKLDAVANDEITNFCPAVTAYGAGDKGTPGTANAECPPYVPAGSCFDADTGMVRPIARPAVGDLVFSEFMPNPSGADGEREWLELYATNTVDLNELELSSAATSTSKNVITASDCLTVQKGSYAVFARSTDPAVNGGLPFVTYKMSLTLNNTAATLAIADGATVIDQVAYSGTTEGEATQLDQPKLDATSNDDPANFCPAITPYSSGADLGTPGSENVVCGTMATPRCFDTGLGMLRDVVVPQVGDLVITEFLANPAAVDDVNGEYFEVLVKANVDLNGIQIANEGTGNTTINPTNCLRPGAGSYVIFARKTDPAVNGGLPPVAGTFSFGLNNTGTTGAPRALILRRESFVLDKVEWITSTAGASTQLSSDKLDATQNDDLAAFCVTPTGTTYGAGDRGTPAQQNSLCP